MDADHFLLNPDATIKEFKHPNPSTFEFHRRQYFSLPFGIISYISKNPISPQNLEKIQKSCKYFFVKNKIIVSDKWVCQNDDKEIFLYGSYDHKCNLKKFKHIRFWLTGHLNTYNNHLLKSVENIFRCSLRSLVLDKQNFTVAEMDFLLNGGKITWLRLVDVNIYDANGALVACDQILVKVPTVKVFEYRCNKEIFTNEAFQKMNELKFNSKFPECRIYILNLSPYSDISLLCKFIKNNAKKDTRYVFYLSMINRKIHRSNLLSALNEMIESWETKEKPSVLIF